MDCVHDLPQDVLLVGAGGSPVLCGQGGWGGVQEGGDEDFQPV